MHLAAIATNMPNTTHHLHTQPPSRSLSSPPRVDGYDKISGRARYVDDIRYPGMLSAATLRTTAAGGEIEKILFDPAWDWDDFIIVTARDIPGVNAVHMIQDDQPILVDRYFRHAGEAVVLIAHADPVRLAQAVAAIKIIEKPQAQPVFDMTIAQTSATQLVPGNIFTQYEMTKGTPPTTEDGLVVIDTYCETHSQEHLYIEPQGMIARIKENILIVEGSLQCPYYVRDALVQATGLMADTVRVIQNTTGGGFGGKEEYPSLIACHAALLTLRAGGRPVKLVYGRGEDLRVTPKRHPSRTRVRLSANTDGHLQSIDIDFTLNGGAYLTLSPVVLSRGLIHAPGPYRCEHIHAQGRAIATNHPPFGAFRGFGAPQSIFAMETAMDQLAHRLALDPAELRRRNILGCADTFPTGHLVGADAPLDVVLARALTESQYTAKRAAYTKENTTNPLIRRGIGLATFNHGSGFTGNGEMHLQSQAALRISADGDVVILTSSAEIGQGVATTFAQIVAHALHIPADRVSLGATDTATVPNSGPTVASRTCMVVGRILEQACAEVLTTLAPYGFTKPYALDRYVAACAQYHALHGPLTVTAHYEPPPGIVWDDQLFRGAAYASYAWAAYVADIAIDMTTFAVSVKDFVAVQEIGRAIHPVIAQGQIEGGVVQGIGWALYEDIQWTPTGVMANDRLTNYILPTTADIPPIRVFFEEQAKAPGPSGAKGLGELPMDGPAPAIANAVAHALGIPISTLPLSPERLWAAWSATEAGVCN